MPMVNCCWQRDRDHWLVANFDHVLTIYPKGQMPDRRMEEGLLLGVCSVTFWPWIFRDVGHVSCRRYIKLYTLTLSSPTQQCMTHIYHIWFDIQRFYVPIACWKLTWSLRWSKSAKAWQQHQHLIFSPRWCCSTMIKTSDADARLSAVQALVDMGWIGWIYEHHQWLQQWQCNNLLGGLVAINFIFPYIGLLIIPIDFHIFQRGGPTTNQQ